MSPQTCKPYAEYKDSQRNWLGGIPSHWSAFALKFLSSERVKDGPHETPNFVDEGIPFFSVDGIQDNELVLEGCRFISETDHERYSQKCRPATGDVLLGKAASVGKVAHVQLTQPFNVWSPLAVIRPRDQRMGRYIYYSIQSAYLQAQCLVQSNSNTQNNLSMRAIDNLYFPAPPVEEQTQIAKFLDYETAKIDALIEKQQQLIALLKEKRQAVISHAVTKGLNPDAPFRDSGVEWLGEVPAHWVVKRFRHVCDKIIAGPFGSALTKDMYKSSGFRVYGQEQVIPNDFSIGDYYISKAHYVALSRYKIESGDLLISCVGTFGKIAVFPTTAEKGIINPRLIKATAQSDVNPQFLREVLKSEIVSKQFDRLSRGGTMGVINIAILSEVVLALPPRQEQDELFDFIDKQTQKFNSLIQRSDEVVSLLQERRTALISAAVTGKIDVRGWKPPESKPETEAA